MPLYVYALLGDLPRRPLPSGVTGESLRSVRCGDVYAVAGDMLDGPSLDRASLVAQDALVRKLTSMSASILPARFGTLVRDESALSDLVRGRALEVGNALALVRGREQMTLRLFSTPPTSDAENVAFPIPAIPMADPSNREGTRYLTRLAAERAARHTVAGLDRLSGPLTTIVRAERVTRHERGGPIASVYHLIDRGKSGEYERRLDAARRVVSEWRVHVTGPHPPYAFVPEPIA